MPSLIPFLRERDTAFPPAAGTSLLTFALRSDGGERLLGFTSDPHPCWYRGRRRPPGEHTPTPRSKRQAHRLTTGLQVPLRCFVSLCVPETGLLPSGLRSPCSNSAKHHLIYCRDVCSPCKDHVHRWLEETNEVSFVVQNVSQGLEETLRVQRVCLPLLGWGLGEGAANPLNSNQGLHHCQSPPPLCPPQRSIWLLTYI